MGEKFPHNLLRGGPLSLCLVADPLAHPIFGCAFIDDPISRTINVISSKISAQLVKDLVSDPGMAEG